MFLIVFWQIWKPQSGVNNEVDFTDAAVDLLLYIRSEINYVHFSWLCKDGPYILFGIVISNASPFDIEITGVEGSANINDTTCVCDAKVPTNFDTVAVPKLTWQRPLAPTNLLVKLRRRRYGRHCLRARQSLLIWPGRVDRNSRPINHKRTFPPKARLR